MKKNKPWLLYALSVTVLWGIWGALIEIPEKAGFPATLAYIVWALTMVPVTLFALWKINWKLDHDYKSIMYGLSAGLLGCGGQLILFQALTIAPAYLFFPIISLFPAVTIILSVLILNERASKRSWFGIGLALLAIVMLSYQEPGSGSSSGYLWLLSAIIIFLIWGGQAFIIRYASRSSDAESMEAESITFYTMVSAIILAPVALLMTDFSQEINWGYSGAYAASIIQLLNAVGFLFFAYALRYGKAIIVVPMMSLAPVVTVLLSLMLYAVIPHPIIITGMILAFIVIYLLSLEEAVEEIPAKAEQLFEKTK